MPTFMGWVSLIFLTSSISLATELQWIKMAARLQINAPGTCHNGKVGDEFYLSAEVDGATLRTVRLQNTIQVWPFSNIYKWIDLTPSERAQVKSYRDKKGSLWIEELGLGERLLKWILYYPSERESCRLAEPVTKLSPSSITAKFDLEGVEEGVLYVQSGGVKLTGELASGAKFDVDLIVTQKFQPWGWE